ncbi:MAG: PrsW family glutamic-type intramembrane protease [Lachnospiraceae bacterium]|jgi:RsiW-degrading membrane proteinase PrsW (M82 family)|nr:PrsW family glutamic-type intramembrane protease [Lachnospiraceae bacterium]MEE3460639.1 PrsW family glutamic-type intramembrane protease [Lachnospiraceae bacterium]
MFGILMAPILTYNWILIVAAVAPAIYLMVKVYRSDRLEPESPGMLINMAVSGIISALIAIVLERIGSFILDLIVPQSSGLYNIIMFFVIVAFSEEGAKFYMLRRRSWFSAEFNCQYDGIVYAVFVSLGFALFENIMYVFQYGFSTALVRAVTAIPGHASFGVFMGAFYGLARGAAYMGLKARSKTYRNMAVIIPALVHGTYDYIASMGTTFGSLIFVVFIIILFFTANHLVNRMSANDQYITNRGRSDFDWHTY